MTAIKENLCLILKIIKGCSIPVCTMQLQLMLLVLDWQTDTNTSTAFNYLELKLFQSWWHMYHPTQSYREDATSFCFQQKFLQVCVDVTCLQCVIYLVIWFFVGISFLHVFRLSPTTTTTTIQCCNHWITPVLSCTETTKHFLKIVITRKSQSMIRIFTNYTLQVYILIVYVCTCQILFCTIKLCHLHY